MLFLQENNTAYFLPYFRLQQNVYPLEVKTSCLPSVCHPPNHKKQNSGDVDYEYHHIIKGLYAHLFIVAYRPLSFPVKCG